MRRITAALRDSIKDYFALRGWTPLAFQRETWRAIAQGKSGLVHAPTGMGKTQAIWLGACMHWQAHFANRQAALQGLSLQGPALLWITPMRALASDSLAALREPFAQTPWADRFTVAMRTGDTPSAERKRQERRWPFALITTPESLCLMLSRTDALQTLGNVRFVIVDEWHELLGSKRGVLLQLALAWLRGHFAHPLQVWALSASLGNLEEAARVLIPEQACMISSKRPKPIAVDCLLPAASSRLAWAGHLGLAMCEQLAQSLDGCKNALVFTNTRSQAELWYQALLEARPQWAGCIALHHASLDLTVRRWVEQALKAGQLSVVVCTSSLDLGVDFSPVEKVIQIGSPKGVARLMQRADLIRRHRMNMGTILSDASIQVKMMQGARLGSVEESFISRLRRGDCFIFSGRLLELVRLHDMTAYVRKARGTKAAVPRWNGGKMPLSLEMSKALARCLDEARKDRYEGDAMRWAKHLLELQAKVSALPDANRLLIESYRSRDGYHWFFYPLQGRQVHLGLATLLGWRLARERPRSFSIAVNDYGFEMLSAEPLEQSQWLDPSLWRAESLASDGMESFNASELAQRRFREIARVAGLVQQSYPSRQASAKQLQASSSLFWEVFNRYDPDNLLLDQARREVLDHELEHQRLEDALLRINQQSMHWQPIERLSPFAFPLMLERLRESLSNEKLQQRLARMIAELSA
ncbi:MAG: DEAD/DEAH box helicase [Betaproteobacteria bacterium]|nr:DEAD/DEAH box helicase [Betaproteobacteria bacterium]